MCCRAGQTHGDGSAGTYRVRPCIDCHAPAEAQLHVSAKGSCHGSDSIIFQQYRSHSSITRLPICKSGALHKSAELFSLVAMLHGYDRPICPLQIAQCSVHKSGALLLEDREGQYWDENLDRSCRPEEPVQQDCPLGELRTRNPKHLVNPDWPFSAAMIMSELPIVSPYYYWHCTFAAACGIA